MGAVQTISTEKEFDSVFLPESHFHLAERRLPFGRPRSFF